VGSFSEVVLGFNFQPDTPADVLAAVAALEQPIPADAWWGPAPQLPAPVTEPDDFWLGPDWRESGAGDEFEAEQWKHDWASWLGGSMSVETVGSAALIWAETKRWNLTCRCSFKSWPEAILTFLAWLGPFIDVPDGDALPRFVGYIEYDEETRPFLLWARGGHLTMEDLNDG
jgi:hypothetical protein